MNTISKTKLVLLAVVLMLLLLIFTQVSTPEDTNQQNDTTTIDTSDWVTYVNDELGFELKHPEGWGVKSEEQRSGSGSAKAVQFYNEEDDLRFVVVKYDESGDAYDFVTQEAEWLKENASWDDFAYEVDIIDDFVYLGMKGVKYYVWFEHNNVVYEDTSVYLNSGQDVWVFPYRKDLESAEILNNLILK